MSFNDNIEVQYLELLKRIIYDGSDSQDRTNTGTCKIWGAHLRCKSSEGFPLITTKRMWFKGIVAELLWMLSGSDTLDFLEEHGASHIWSPWVPSGGTTGEIYGPSWRNWNRTGLDQLKTVIGEIKTNPNSRRHLVLAWNPSAVWSNNVCLAPCHFAFQFQVDKDTLNANWMMRSSDAFIGLPWNLAFYSLLQRVVAQVCGLKVGDLTFWGNDVHLYSNHIPLAARQLMRGVRALPDVIINPDVKDIDKFVMNDFEVDGYDPCPAIKAEIAV